MSCKHCHKDPCGCGGGSQNGNQSGELTNALAQLAVQQDQIDALTSALGPLLKGHPILLVEHPDDVASFDIASGVGSGNYEGWGICNGNQYSVPGSPLKITTPNMTDRVPVGAGGLYAVDDLVGADSVQLTVGQLPAHNHTVTDPGHTHVINDPGHNHAITDPGHSHGASSAPHGHTLTILAGGDHNHAYAGSVDQISNSGTGAFAYDGSTLSSTSVSGNHTHNGTADNTSVTVTVQDAFTGIVINNDFTGITNASATTGVTIGNTGNGDNIDIRQKSYAVFFAMKIY